MDELNPADKLPADVAKEQLKKILGHNYHRYIEYRLAGDFACDLMKAWNARSTPTDDQWREPDDGTPDNAAVWVCAGRNYWVLGEYAIYRGLTNTIILAKENQGQPPDNWEPEKPKDRE
ncbi:MAG: hypothetical protein PVJ39_04630 [Gammaproteobacteria bacterium]|jgi:hypothetical protein